MKFIEELMQGEQVQWKPLGEVVQLEKGKQLNKTELLEAGDYPAYNGGVSYSGFTHTYNYPENTIIISQGGASAGFVNYVTTKFWANAHCYVVLPNEEVVLKRYVYHFLKMHQDPLMTRQQGAGIPALNASTIKELLIPIPPLAVQRRIVEVLDKFSELTAELTARKKQYEYYRNKLLSFEGFAGAITYKPLGEVFEMRNGYTPSKANPDFWEGGTIPWYRMEDIRINGRILSDAIQHITPGAVKGSGLFRSGSIIMATTATIGEHALLIADSLANQQFTNFSIRKSLADVIDIKFAFYYFFILGDECKKKVNVSSFPSVDMDWLKKQAFPIPPLEEQRRIVDILDKFDTLVNSLTEGLPREIELRRKQYEYYRNKLLAFPAQ